MTAHWPTLSTDFGPVAPACSPYSRQLKFFADSVSPWPLY